MRRRGKARHLQRLGLPRRRSAQGVANLRWLVHAFTVLRSPAPPHLASLWQDAPPINVKRLTFGVERLAFSCTAPLHAQAHGALCDTTRRPFASAGRSHGRPLTSANCSKSCVRAPPQGARGGPAKRQWWISSWRGGRWGWEYRLDAIQIDGGRRVWRDNVCCVCVSA